MDPMVCCYNGEAFQFGSTITTVGTADNCITTSLECGEEGVKTRIERRCSGPATPEQVREIRCLIEQHLAESGTFHFYLNICLSIGHFLSKPCLVKNMDIHPYQTSKISLKLMIIVNDLYQSSMNTF